MSFFKNFKKAKRRGVATVMEAVGKQEAESDPEYNVHRAGIKQVSLFAVRYMKYVDL